MKRVLIRSELIEFATLPIVFPISPEQTYKSFEPFLSKIDAKINLDTISNILCQLIPNFGERDVEVLYLLYKVVVDGEIGFLSNSLKRKDWTNHTIKTRSFCIFLYLQNYRTSTTLSKREVAGGWAFNEGIKSNKSSNASFSPLNSPRSKAMRSTSQNDTAQNLVSFIKQNLYVLLKIACGITDFKSKDSFKVTPQELELLGCIFSLAEDKEVTSFRPLGELLPKDLDSNSVIALIDKALSASEGRRE